MSDDADIQIIDFSSEPMKKKKVSKKKKDAKESKVGKLFILYSYNPSNRPSRN